MINDLIKNEIKYIEIDKIIRILDKCASRKIITQKQADELIHEIYEEMDPKRFKKP